MLIPGVTDETDSCEFTPPSRRTRTRTGSRTCSCWLKLMTSVGMVFELSCKLAHARTRVDSQDTCLTLDASTAARRRCSGWRGSWRTKSRWTRGLRGEWRLARGIEGRVESCIVWARCACVRSARRERSQTRRQSKTGGERPSDIASSGTTRCGELLCHVENVFVQVSSLAVSWSSWYRALSIRSIDPLRPTGCQRDTSSFI